MRAQMNAFGMYMQNCICTSHICMLHFYMYVLLCIFAYNKYMYEGVEVKTGAQLADRGSLLLRFRRTSMRSWVPGAQEDYQQHLQI